MEPNQALLNEGLKKLFQAIASKDGITVIFDRECKTPHVDQNMRVTLPPPSAVDADKYWYYAMHELGHLFSELDWTFKDLWDRYFNPKDQLTVHVCNLVVDNLNERNFYGQYEGVDLIMNKGRAKSMTEFMDSLNSRAANSGNEVADLLLAGIMVDAEERQDWMGAHIQAQNYRETTDANFKEMADKIRGIGYKQRVKRILEAKDPTAECASLVKDLLALIDHKPQEPQGGGKGDGEGEGEAGSGACSECQGTGTNDDGTECESCGGSGDCQDCQGSGVDESGEPCGNCHSDRAEAPKGQKEMGQDRHESNQTSAESKGSGHDCGSEYARALSDYDLGKLLRALDKRMNTPPLERPKETTDYRHRYGSADGYLPWDRHSVKECERDYLQGEHHPGMRTAIEKALGNSTVSKQVSKFLKALVSESYVYGQRSGKLHQKSLHRLVSHNAMSGQQPSIYKKRNSTMVKLDSAVTVQLDCSGSMSGSKYVIGAACCVAICDTLNALGIPHEILGFTEHRGLTSYVFKNFGTKLTKEKLTAVMATQQVSMSQNADGESVLWAAERLMLRPEGNKLHIVLSDGMPCGSYHGDGAAYLKHVCNMLETQSPINLVGIGICTHAVESFYRHNVVVNDPAQLDRVLFKVLRDFLV